MVRNIFLGLLLALSLDASARAQDWARKMFETTSHDFGSVPRGAKAQYSFTVTNPFKEEVHIASVRSSCGCTSPQITIDTLKTYEKGAVVATYNTKSFLGQKGATLTVVVDRPYYAEVQLQVTGYIRSDVLLTPGGIEFGSVDVGTAAAKKIDIQYSGDDSWRITAIKSPNAHVTAEAVEINRGGGQALYKMSVNLAATAPVGYIKDSLIIQTNDRNAPQFTVEVEGRVVSEVMASPASLFLGVLKSGQTVTKQVVVRAKKPFKILSVECPEDRFKFEMPSDAKPVHLVPVTFTAGEEPGRVQGKIVIKTDLGESASTELVAYAQVTAR